jgi:hypothetical protein
MSYQPRANILLLDSQHGGYRDIGIQRVQRRVVQLLCLRVKPVELVGPATYDDDLAEPWFERCN